MLSHNALPSIDGYGKVSRKYSLDVARNLAMVIPILKYSIHYKHSQVVTDGDMGILGVVSFVSNNWHVADRIALDIDA